MDDSTATPFATTRFGETAARFSPDGRFIAYASDESGRAEVYIAPFRRPGPRVAVSTGGGAEPRWSHDGRELFYVQSNSALLAVQTRLLGESVEIGQTRTLFHGPLRGGGSPYDVAADGRILVNRAVDDPTPPPITLVVNWPASLPK